MEEKTTVQTVEGGEIILVGEEHRNQDSRELAERVIEEVDPQTIAVERSGKKYPITSSTAGGMEYGAWYAEQEKIPLLHVDTKHDKPFRLRRKEGYGTLSLSREANKFSHPIEEDGDVDPRAISDARERVREQFGDDIADAMYIDREEMMVKNLLWAKENFPTPIVVNIGTFHILRMKELFNEIDEDRAMEEDEIFFNSQVEEGTTEAATAD